MTLNSVGWGFAVVSFLIHAGGVMYYRRVSKPSKEGMHRIQATIWLAAALVIGSMR